MSASRNFTINNQFIVEPASNVLRQQAQEIRLEQRVMEVLCLLAETAGTVVSRETLMEKIWENRGGADEALTQAISHLRKVLKDDDKKIIETVPKKGYILRASVSEYKNEAPEMRGGINRKQVLNILSAALVVLLLFLIFLQTRNQNSKPQAFDYTEASKPEEETYYNTITTRSPDSTVYKLIVIGDQRPRFYINGTLISPDSMESYLPMINNLKKELQRRNEEK